MFKLFDDQISIPTGRYRDLLKTEVKYQLMVRMLQAQELVYSSNILSAMGEELPKKEE